MLRLRSALTNNEAFLKAHRHRWNLRMLDALHQKAHRVFGHLLGGKRNRRQGRNHFGHRISVVKRSDANIVWNTQTLAPEILEKPNSAPMIENQYSGWRIGIQNLLHELLWGADKRPMGFQAGFEHAFL